MAVTLAERARRLNLGTSGDRSLPPLILIIDSTRLPNPEAAIAALPRGGAVILRDYDDPARNIRAAILLRLCRHRGLRFLLAGDGAMAATLGADGLHLPERLLHLAPRWRQANRLITGAAHSWPALIRAARFGLDAVLLSPVFATRSHPRGRALGPVRFAALATRCPLPVYALGGIDAGNACRLINSGAVGIAGISGFARP